MSIQLENTFDPMLKSWLASASGSDFPIQNLPFGVFELGNGKGARVGVAIGDHVIDLYELSKAGLLPLADHSPEIFCARSLNELASAGSALRVALRCRLSELLREEGGDPALQKDDALQKKAIWPQSAVKMLLPVEVGDFVDFYSSLEHASNVGSMFRDPKNPLLPNWKHIPIGYHGRSSSLVVSGTPIPRPFGQLQSGDDAPIYAPTNQLDFELEMGFIVSKNTNLGERLQARTAHEAMFGMVLVNDWSARDIQRWEYVPLGPFLGKSFATTVSPWVVTMEVIEKLRTAEPVRDVPILPYLEDGGDKALDIELCVKLRSAQMHTGQVIAQTNFRGMYWTVNQQLAHMTSNGTPIRVGDVYASGTVSGKDAGSFGSMLELCWKGTRPLSLQDGSSRIFLQDGDEISMTATARLPGGVTIGFGKCDGQVSPAIKL